MAFHSAWIGDALGIRPQFDREYSVITSDSRKANRGSIFIALPGDQFDGHDFIRAAVQSGAEAVISDRNRIPSALPANVEVFAVDDTVKAYRALAHAWRNTFTIPFICVAGSVGKTTTKELLSAILRGRYREVISTAGSQNGFIGIPMTLLSIPSTADMAVIEVGIDEPGAMVQHIELVSPTHSLLTAIGPEHLEKLIDLKTVAHEEGLALSLTAEKGGTVIVRLDDEWIREISNRLPSDAHFWTCRMKSEVGESDAGKKALLSTSVRGEYIVEQEVLRVTLADGSGFELALPLPGAHNAGNLLVAVTTACALSLSPIEIQRGLSTFRGVSGRSELKVLPGPTPVLCDYYNANPTSVEAGLDVLSGLATKYHSKRKIAVLGDMLELGPNEESFHRGLADKIRSTGVDSLFLYGERMKWLFQELSEHPSSRKLSLHHFTTHENLANSLAEEVQSGDAILVKGSRGMKMELVWDAAWKKIEPVFLGEATVTGRLT